MIVYILQIHQLNEINIKTFYLKLKNKNKYKDKKNRF
jgi:hypothetical protein